MRQAKSRAIKSSKCQGMAQRLFRRLGEIGCDQYSQYEHTAWTARDGFSVGAIFAMAQTPDGYLWLGSEFGLYRFDGVQPVLWQPPAGQQLPHKPYALLVTRDGTLWIGTFEGLVSWSGGKLTYYLEIGKAFVTSLLQDREGTVWVGTFGGKPLPARVCAIRAGRVQCKGEDGAFGSFVWSLGEDGSGTLWAGADSGVWRLSPEPAQRYAIPGLRVGDLLKADDGRLLIGISGAGLKRPVGRIRTSISPDLNATVALLTEPLPEVDQDDGLHSPESARGHI